MTRRSPLKSVSKYLMLFAVMFAVSACGDEEPTVENQPPAGHEDITSSDSLQEIYDGDAVDPNAPTPGTQADLVVNVGDRVFFGTDRYDLSTEARQVLDAQAAWLQQYPNVNLTIEGHADERGTREYNLALGERRANSVRNYLTALGVSPTRLTTVTYGKERPAVPGANEAAWAQNRRGVSKVN